VAVLDPNKATALLMRSGAGECLVVLALRNVNAGDTVDIGPSGANQLQTIDRCVAIGAKDSVEISCVRTGTVVTIPGGFSNGDGYMTALGSST
jgi:hypothetical protein